MKRYLTKFSTRAEYTAALENLDFPNVTYLSEDDEMVFAQNAPEPPAHDYSLDYFTIEITDGTDVLHVGDGYETESLQHSVDGGNTWESHVEPDGMEVKAGDKIMLKCTDHLTPYDSIIAFDGDVTYNVYGNIMSLVYGDDFVGKTSLWKDSEFVFTKMFASTRVVDASNLVMPATDLTLGCYSEMFKNCSYLTAAPELPATRVAETCYQSMFEGCTSLTTAPALPATEGQYANFCYMNMFSGCTSLTTAPELPATTLADGCYGSMFAGCTSLTTAPALPATTLAMSCYNSMFQGCTSLTTAPELPAEELVEYCYNSMFKGCNSLNYIKMLATDVTATECLMDWVDGVSPTGTFVKHPDADLPSGESGIPAGWTVETATE